jgi:hypothetical protein
VRWRRQLCGISSVAVRQQRRRQHGGGGGSVAAWQRGGGGGGNMAAVAAARRWRQQQTAPRQWDGSTRPTSGRSSAMTRISFNLKFALRQHDITPPSSSKQASRSTPNGSQEKRTMLPRPFLVISIVQLVNSPKSSAKLAPPSFQRIFK